MSTERQKEWVATMHGHGDGRGLVLAHRSSPPPSIDPPPPHPRAWREELEAETLAPGATLAAGAGRRAAPRSPTRCAPASSATATASCTPRPSAAWPARPRSSCFPDDHQRTRLTHALEVAQVATSIARAVGLNVALTEAIALGHDCGHGPGGHASEDAFDPFVARRLRPRRLGGRRGARPAQPVRRDARRHPQPLAGRARRRPRPRARS